MQMGKKRDDMGISAPPAYDAPMMQLGWKKLTVNFISKPQNAFRFSLNSHLFLRQIKRWMDGGKGAADIWTKCQIKHSNSEVTVCIIDQNSHPGLGLVMHKTKKILPNAMYNEDCVDLSNELMLSGEVKHFSIDLFQY